MIIIKISITIYLVKSISSKDLYPSDSNLILVNLLLSIIALSFKLTSGFYPNSNKDCLFISDLSFIYFS